MTDYSELKKLAEACDVSKCADEAEYGRCLAEFYDECEPEEILALIAESMRLEVQRDSAKTLLTDALRREEQLKAGFKNFHHSLCVRFGYYHDEVDWQRDQVSLEEHIASQFDHVNAENGALRAQTETVQRGAGQLKAENEALLNGMTRIMHATHLGDPAFAIACEVVGELSGAAMGKESFHG